jgi:hypothetical protein
MMKLPGFTAEASIRKANFDYYSAYAPSYAAGKNKFQSIIGQIGDCRPRCGPCTNGLQTCITADCNEYERRCGCQPHCGECINCRQQCQRSDCSIYYADCSRCQPIEWCEGSTLVRRDCECNEFREPEYWGCVIGPL